jgi:hypothetical protein
MTYVRKVGELLLPRTSCYVADFVHPRYAADLLRRSISVASSLSVFVGLQPICENILNQSYSFVMCLFYRGEFKAFFAVQTRVIL